MYAILRLNDTTRRATIQKLELIDNLVRINSHESMTEITVGYRKLVESETEIIAKLWLDERLLMPNVSAIAFIDLYISESELIGKGWFTRNKDFSWESCDKFYTAKDWANVEQNGH